ncbi:MAG TPA: abortive infection protein [Thermoplasmata archaeon]|nr:abortive infection protein [Thermoplasmata archaeon]
MRVKGVCYDVGIVMGMNWRPVFEPSVVRRELQIIHTDLHCNAVRIVGHRLERLLFATEAALALGLDVWYCPQFWNRSASKTARYLARAAEAVEPLRQRWPDKVVFSVGSEISLFSRGILPGRTFTLRMNNPRLAPIVRSGRLRAPLNAFLSQAVKAVRAVYRGRISYASLIWEGVDWTPFDYVGIDHYRTTSIEDRYLEMLRPAFATGKPVVITEFGYETMKGGPMSEGFLSSAGLKPSLIDVRSQYFHQLPLLGRFVRPRLKATCLRDEGFQARKLTEQLGLLETVGVDGAFVSQFVSQITPYDPDPRFDLDVASSSLVRYLERGRGATYPEMPWEPKESFWAVAEWYRNH